MATAMDSSRPDLGSLRIGDGERKGSGIGKRIMYAAIPVLIFAGIVAAAFAFRSQKPVVEVAAAAKADPNGRQTLLNASGYVTPRRRATIAAKITGRVTGVFFDEGTRVAEGQLLATLDDSDVKRALDSAKADRDASRAAIADFEVQLKNAQIALRRAEQLQKAGVQTQEALDNATTAADSLKAKIELARQQVAAAESRIGVAQQAVDNCTIRAPFAGIVVSKDAQVGEMVSPISAGGGFTRTGIATIVDMRSNEFEVDVNESYIARVEPGRPPKGYGKSSDLDSASRKVQFHPPGHGGESEFPRAAGGSSGKRPWSPGLCSQDRYSDRRRHFVRVSRSRRKSRAPRHQCGDGSRHGHSDPGGRAARRFVGCQGAREFA